MITTTAPGKVNLCLFVGASRADGYHPLVSVFQSVSLADELVLEFTGDRDTVVCPGVDGPNLAAKAIAAYRETTGWDGPPVRITITKHVPVAAGMGGGSGDAAAALRLMAEAAGDAAPLARIAPALGADVPFQLRQGRALVTGIGERVEPMITTPPSPPAAFVIYPSEHTLSTKAVYAEFDRLGRHSDLAAAERDIRAGGLPDANDLEDAARSLCPSIDTALEQLHTAGADAVLVAGSGPTVFGRFDDPERAAAVAAVLPGAIAVEPVAPLPFADRA